MNYVELHIGDYETATSHLTACEDGIYGRLLRRYYSTEEPLPADLKAVQRLVRARAKDEREAVQTVLDEFFQLTDDGWRHKRCDEEIQRYQAKQGERAGERENEAERKRRYRQRRAELFEALRERGIVPDFDTPMRTLETLLSRGTTTGRETGHGVGQDGDGTANQSPVTRHQTKAKASGATHTTGQAPGVGLPAGHAAAALNRAGCRVTSQNPDLIAACAEGVTTEHLLEVRSQFPDKPAGYVIATARREHAASAKPITGGTHAPAQRPGRLSAAERVERNIRARHEPQRAADGAIDVDFEPVQG